MIRRYLIYYLDDETGLRASWAVNARTASEARALFDRMSSGRFTVTSMLEYTGAGPARSIPV